MDMGSSPFHTSVLKVSRQLPSSLDFTGSFCYICLFLNINLTAISDIYFLGRYDMKGPPPPKYAVYNLNT